MIPRVNIAIVDNSRVNAELREQAIHEIEDLLPALPNTKLFSSADDLIQAVDENGEYFEVIISDIYMPERGDDLESTGRAETGGLRVKRWLEFKRNNDEDFNSVQLILISRYSDVSQFIHEHVNISTSDWIDWLSHNNSFELMKVDLTKVLDHAIRRYNPIELLPDLPKHFITISPDFIHVIDEARRVAASDIPVLIQGESGTGKELIARFIHEHSRRKDRAYVATNCAAASETLLGDELFGRVKGAFSGAHTSRQGLFGSANGGTLFLDEIGEMVPIMQAKLLRTLQEKVYTPLGTDNQKATDFRLISATNRDLEREVIAGRFRQDLFYRIQGAQLRIPTLRERPEDIEPLAEYFIHLFAKKEKKGVVSLTDAALKALKNHQWPGNVRELQGAMERAVALINYDGHIDISHLPLSVSARDHRQGFGPLSTEEQVRYNAIANHGYNLSAAAKFLGHTKQALSKYVKDHPKLNQLVKEAIETIKGSRERSEESKNRRPSPAFRQEDQF